MPFEQGSCLFMLSFDVEDWFQTERFRLAIPRNRWDSCEFRITESVGKILNILRKHHTRATFFVLGWIAERFPNLVLKIKSEGHEIASHGYAHEVLCRLTERELEKDILRSKRILEEITGDQIIGYRAPRFSIVNWLPSLLCRHGFLYDSSLFPSTFIKHYGKVRVQKLNDNISIGRFYNGLLEVPIATLEFLNKRLPWGGGVYFRFYPYWLFKMGIRVFIKRQNGYLFYLHPWEIDPDQPRIANVPWMSKLFHYGFLSTTEKKLDKLLHDFHFVPIREGLVSLGLL